MVKSDVSTVINLIPTESATLANTNYQFVQDEDSTEDGIAITPYGTIIAPYAESGGSEVDVEITPKLTINGVGYTASAAIHTVSGGSGGSAYTAVAVGDTVTMAKDA